MKGSETYGKGLSKNPTMIFIFGYLKLSELSGDWFISMVPWTGWYDITRCIESATFWVAWIWVHIISQTWIIWVYFGWVVLTWQSTRLHLLSDFWQITVKPCKTKKQPWTFGCRQILGLKRFALRTEPSGLDGAKGREPRSYLESQPPTSQSEVPRMDHVSFFLLGKKFQDMKRKNMVLLEWCHANAPMPLEEILHHSKNMLTLDC